MPSPCRIIPGSPYTVASSGSPITCILYNAPSTTKITAATSVDHATGNATPLTVAADGQSFQLPINSPGLYVVNATINSNGGVVVHITEDCPSHTVLLWITDKTDNFVLQVN